LLCAAALSLPGGAARASELPTQQARVEEAEDAKFRGAVSSISVFGVPEMITQANRKWRDLYTGALLDRGEIKTGRKGRVQLRLADGSKLRLGPGSSLTLETLRHTMESGAIELALEAGELNYERSEQARSNQALVVRTAVVTATANGARFSVRHAADRQTTIAAIAGSVRVERRDGSAAVTLSEGEQISIGDKDRALPKPSRIP
jgi:hypothetical protein